MENNPNIDYLKTLEIFQEIIKSQQSLIEKLVETNINSNLNVLPMLAGLLNDKVLKLKKQES